MSGVIRSLALFTCACVALLFGAYGDARAATTAIKPSKQLSARYTGDNGVMRFHDATITEFVSSTAYTNHCIVISLDSGIIYKSLDNDRGIGNAAAFDNMPRQGMSTLIMSQYSGGGHCCYSDYLLTKAEDRWIFTEVRFDDVGDMVELNHDMSLPLKLMDSSFAYYETNCASKDFFGLSYAYSPMLTRFLVFDGQGWRVDRLGEFRQKYRLLAEKSSIPRTEGECHLAKTSRLMEVAYYQYMSGMPGRLVFEAFRRELPEETRGCAQAVWADIKRAARRYNPVSNSVYY